jgi:thiol-disulfide isomerase/thioredoxin
MKMRIILAITFLLVTIVASAAEGQNPSARANIPELDALVARIQAKIRTGKNTAADLVQETADFAALRAKTATQAPEIAARVAYLQYTFQLDVLKDQAAAMETRKELTANYRTHLADTPLARQFEAEARFEKAKEAQAGLVGKPAPELNFIWASHAGFTKLSDLKGKVVVLDFWATWCGPCLATFPQIRELVAHYKDLDVVVLGVTSVQGYVSGLTPARIDTKGDPQKEFGLMSEFIKAKEMTWPVVFASEAVFNTNYGVIGIPHMAIIAPDGTVRHNGLHPAMPHTDKVKKIDAILKEFGKDAVAHATIK